jgi:hypothetical protein
VKGGLPMFEINTIQMPTGSTGSATSESTPLPRHKSGQHFLKGPVPLDWLCVASRRCGKGSGFTVGIIIWFLCGLKKSRARIRLKGAVVRRFGLTRYACYRGLADLEKALLVSVERHPGRNPLVTVLPVPDQEEELRATSTP